MDTFKEIIDNKENTPEPVAIDPKVLLECAGDVEALVDSHVKILESIKHIIWRFKKAGYSPDRAAQIAYALHKRASTKAQSMVPNCEPDGSEDEKNE